VAVSLSHDRSSLHFYSHHFLWLLTPTWPLEVFEFAVHSFTQQTETELLPRSSSVDSCVEIAALYVKSLIVGTWKQGPQLTLGRMQTRALGKSVAIQIQVRF
jgi:hypothetical protein